MNFIQKLVKEEVDELVHLQFQKFSKGEFKNRAVIESKKSANKWTIKTSAEFANDLIFIVASELGDKITDVGGAIISTVNLKEIPEFKNFLASAEMKQFQGVKRFIINQKMTGKEITHLLKTFPKAFFGLSFNSNQSQLKIKAKAPKSGKPGKGDEEPKADFCNLKTENKKIVEEFIFESPNFKEAKINHTFLINDIILPKGENDYAKMREMAKRKGKIIRKYSIDGKEGIKEINFEA